MITQFCFCVLLVVGTVCVFAVGGCLKKLDFLSLQSLYSLLAGCVLTSGMLENNMKSHIKNATT